MNGIETAERLRKTDRKVKIIYVTGYQDYMSRSFAVHPFSFLVKPVREEEIIRQVREALLYSGAEEQGTLLWFQTTEGAAKFLASDIYYLEYQSREKAWFGGRFRSAWKSWLHMGLLHLIRVLWSTYTM